MCAERMAIQNAISEGERAIAQIAIYTPTYEMIAPCGLCRQVILEFARSAETLVIMAGETDKYATVVQTHTIGELLPFAYTKRTHGLSR